MLIRFFYAYALLQLAIAPLVCSAQTVIVRGLVDRCSSARCVDADDVIDSIRVDSIPSPLPPYVYLMTMKASAGVTADTTQITLDSSTIGVLRTAIVRVIDDSLLVVRGQPLATSYRNDVVQVVFPIVADTIVVDSLCYPSPWDGRRGGIIALDAQRALVGRGVISVSAMGYRGGRRSVNGGSCGITQACDPETSDRTGGKGESFVIDDPQCRNGHLPWYSGGGGGDAHNAGGGGGANGGAGGRGGDQFVCDPAPGMWGMQGVVAASRSPRVLFGGGGGGGHQNNNVATEGSSGGGAIIIRTRFIDGDSLKLVARGQDVPNRAGNDGGGGGGAGGTVLLDACYTNIPISIDVSGGRGSDCDGGHGPGGGGAGGRIIVHPTLLQNSKDLLRFSIAGGQPGLAASDPRRARQGASGIMQVQCDSIRPHAMFINKHNNVGDTVLLRFEAIDTTARCATDILHRVRFIGQSFAPLTDGLSFYDRVGLTIEHQQPDTTTISVVIPSTTGWAIPFLTVLSRDSTNLLLHAASAAMLDEFPTCRWYSFPDVLTAEACAQRLRLIDEQPKPSVKANSASDRLDVLITSPTNGHISISLFSALGEELFSADAMGLTQSTHQQWQFSQSIDMASRSAGLYLINVYVDQWSTSIPVIHPSY